MVKSRLKILIIGGYGNVGSKVVSILDTADLFIITIAGRNIKKASELIERVSDNVRFCFFDALKYSDNIDIIDNCDIIISCIDLSDEKLAKYVLENGKVYIDFTANYEYINKIEQLNQNATEQKGLAILSVGIVPGLSNLMVKHLQELNHSNNHSEKAEIYVQLGLGDKNGKAAVQWVLNNLNKDYSVKNISSEERFKPFTKGRVEKVFNKSFLFYPFNFSDQHVICKTLNINKAVSYLGFDSNLITLFFSFLKRIGFFTLIRFKLIYNLLLRIFTTMTLGDDLFSVKAKLFTHKKDFISLSVSGSNESLVTAQVACLLIKWINQNRNHLPTGIKHIEQILNYNQVIKELKIRKQEITDYKTLL